MITLKKLTLKNFLSHRNTELDFCDKSGLVLLEGLNEDGKYDSNGSGKSTILEGVVYALSGNTLRNVGVDDIINRTAKKNTEVTLNLDINNKSYEVSRYRKHDKNANQLLVVEDGSDISKRLNKDTQALLDNIVDVPYRVLTSTIVLGEGLSSRFTQLSDPDKKSLIESTLNLSYDLSKSRDAANMKMKELKLEIATLEGSISSLQEITSRDMASEQQKYEEYKNSLPIWTQEKLALEVKINDINIMLESISDKYKVLTNALSQVIQYNNQISQIESAAISYMTELKNLEESPVKICSLCHQELATEDSRNSVRANIQTKLNDCSKSMREVQELLNTLPEKSILESKISELTESEKSFRSNLATLTNDYNERCASIMSATKVMTNIEDALDNMNKYKEDLQVSEETRISKLKSYSEYEYFYKLYSPTGIMTILLEEAISYINTRLAVYTDILLDKSYTLSLVKGKISLVDPKGSTYQTLSNGEKRRLDIAIQFSLHDYVHTYCGIKIDSLFVDEILDTLDATGVSNIIEILNLKKEYCNLNRIIVITHNSELKSYFDNIISIRKSRTGDSIIVNN